MFIRLTGGRRRLATVAAIVITSAIAGAPIRIGSQDQQRPTFRTEANYVRVDAYATTKDGVPIDDLRRDEFELLEDRVLQTIDQFATVRIRGAERRRPGPIRARRKKAVRPQPLPAPASSSSSLDVMNVDRTASIRIAKPLTDALRNLLGPDYLLAVVMPGICVRALTFTRQIATIENALNNPWAPATTSHGTRSSGAMPTVIRAFPSGRARSPPISGSRRR